MSLKLVSFIVLISSCCGNQLEDSEAYLSSFIADLWLEGADVLKVIWRDCSKKLVDVKDVIDHKEYFPRFVRCMKRKTLRALDRSLSLDVVPIAEGVNLVRFELIDGSGNTVPFNKSSTWTDKELDEGAWRTLALKRIAKILHTHVIKFEFDDNQAIDKVEYRGRRRHHMMTMMMFGIVSIGMVLVPMGFQFLAVLGGKALILAKMALILASIQGLKKIASSPLNYGFYHSTFPYEHYEKRSNDNWPKAAITPPTPPPLMTVHSPWPDAKNIEKLDIFRQDESNESNDSRPDKDPVILDDNNIATQEEPRIFPVYQGPETLFNAIDTPTPIIDLTTRPGQVQADYTLELPYNRFRFQGPTSVLSS